MQHKFDNIAVVGFSTFEYSTFETFFRLVSGRRARHYHAVRTVEDARLVVIDGASASQVKRHIEALRPGQDALIVGFTDHGTGLPCIARPINLSMVLATIDKTLGHQTAPAQSSSDAPSASKTARDLDPNGVDSARRSHSLPTRAMGELPHRDDNVRVIAPLGSVIEPLHVARLQQNGGVGSGLPAADGAMAFDAAPQSSTKRSNAPVANVLVVDDSDIALHFIRSRLSTYGFNVDLARSGEEALVRVSQSRYAFVFLDVMMEGLDGYQTCKAIKSHKVNGNRNPVVVMLTSRSGTVDRVRGTFAGCDAYLTKPLDDATLFRVLAKHDPSLVRPAAPSAPRPELRPTARTSPVSVASSSDERASRRDATPAWESSIAAR